MPLQASCFNNALYIIEIHGLVRQDSSVAQRLKRPTGIGEVICRCSNPVGKSDFFLATLCITCPPTDRCHILCSGKDVYLHQWSVYRLSRSMPTSLSCIWHKNERLGWSLYKHLKDKKSHYETHQTHKWHYRFNVKYSKVFRAQFLPCSGYYNRYEVNSKSIVWQEAFRL